MAGSDWKPVAKKDAKAFTVVPAQTDNAVKAHLGLDASIGGTSRLKGLDDDKSASMSVASKLSQKSADWERSRATGSAAVDLTNLFLNPQKPSSINVWQVARVAMPAAGAPAGWQAAVLSC